MRLRQKYVISGKPSNLQEARIAGCKLDMEVRKDLSVITDYLSERGNEIGHHHIPMDKFDGIQLTVSNGNTYYHMKNGLTARVHVASYGKDWLIEKERKHLPQEVDIIVDSFGNGCAKLRQEVREKLGKENRKVIRIYHTKILQP